MLGISAGPGSTATSNLLWLLDHLEGSPDRISFPSKFRYHSLKVMRRVSQTSVALQAWYALCKRPPFVFSWLLLQPARLKCCFERLEEVAVGVMRTGVVRLTRLVARSTTHL